MHRPARAFPPRPFHRPGLQCLHDLSRPAGGRSRGPGGLCKGPRPLPQVRCYEAPFEGEHCLEVQLPFLQLSLEAFHIVPFLVVGAAAEEVAQVIARLWGSEETLILVSSDLSHYLDYEQAKAVDAATTQAIEVLRPEAIAPTQACGHAPLGGLLREAKRRGLEARTLDLRNFGNTAGPCDQVVGYGCLYLRLIPIRSIRRSNAPSWPWPGSRSRTGWTWVVRCRSSPPTIPPTSGRDGRPS